MSLKTILKINIEWDTDIDDEEIEHQDYDEEDLPQFIEIEMESGVTPEEIEEETILEYLTEEYGFLIRGANFEFVYETEEEEEEP